MAQTNFRPINYNDGNFRIEVIRRPEWDMVEVYLLSKVGGVISNGTVEDGQIIMTEIKESSESPPPFLKISGFIWDTFVRALTNDLPNISREEIDAELKATKYHLEDMRKLALSTLGDKDEQTN